MPWRRALVRAMCGLGALHLGCARLSPVGSGRTARLLPYLHDGQTLETDLVARLGGPIYRSPEGVEVFRVEKGKVRYELVVVLDDRGIVQRHSLLSVLNLGSR